MRYTVWIDGTEVGETSFEIRHGSGRLAGVFHPSAPGIALLPGITAMARALLDTGRMCRENGIDPNDPDLDADSATDRVFGTAEGQRVIEAARIAARLELHDARGELVEWDSLLISDMNDFREMSKRAATDGGPNPDAKASGDPIRYFISAQLRPRHPRRSSCGAGVHHRLPQ